SFLALAAGVLILAILAGVAFFLFLQSTDTIKASFDDPSTITGGRGFLPYVFPLIIGTLISAIISLIVATPFAIGIALFTTHMALRKLAPVLGYTIDLLAAIPSVVYGLWGLALSGRCVRLYEGVAQYLRWVAMFCADDDDAVCQTGSALLTASPAPLIMIIPIITSL